MNVPQLRFDGFDGEWKEFSFDQIASITMGQSPSGDSYNTSKQGEPLINGPTEFGDIYPTPVQWTTKPSKFSKPGDTLLCVRGSSIGRMNLSDSRYCIGRGVAAISGLDNKTTSAYMKYVLEKEVEKILKRSTGSTFPNISGHELKQSRISIPNLEEQEKIAKFLTVLDYKREKQQEKIEKLEQFKKGMMQKIFSQELRFKDEDGGEFQEWRESQIGDFVTDYIEKTVENNQYPVLTSSRKGLVFQKDHFNNRQVTTEENTGYHIIPKGYFTYRSRSDDGKFFFNRNTIIDKGIVSYFYPVFNTINIDPNYFWIYINNYLAKEILIEIVGTSQLVLSMNKFKKLTIVTPEIKEQEKIGNFFSKLELKIEKEKEKLMALEEQKKGFMQGVFL